MQLRRFRRVTVNTYSPEAWAMVERMQERIDQEHAWVHRLEDEIARLRNVIDDALLVCSKHPWSGDDTAAAIAATLHRATEKPQIVKEAPSPTPDEATREWAYQKALGYKEQKLNRTRTYVARLESALGKQKAQTADDQRYIDALEAKLPADALGAIREQMREVRKAS